MKKLLLCILFNSWLRGKIVEGQTKKKNQIEEWQSEPKSKYTSELCIFFSFIKEIYKVEEGQNVAPSLPIDRQVSKLARQAGQFMKESKSGDALPHGDRGSNPAEDLIPSE